MSSASSLPRSILNPLPPEGLGTSNAESLLSYFLRLALSHCISAPSLKLEVSAIAGWKQPGKYRLHDINLIGMGTSTVQWSSALSRLTGMDRLELLTMLPWRNVIASVGLFSSQSRWCPLCFSQDREEGRNPYFRLAWDIEAVDACPFHAVKLASSCSNCGRPDARNGTTCVVAGWCSFCGGFLGDSPTPSVATAAGLWTSLQIAKLTATAATLPDTPTRETMLQGLFNIVDRLDDGIPAVFARRIGLNKSTVHHWLSKGGTPAMPALLRISAHAGLELPALLRGDVTNAQAVTIIPGESNEFLRRPHKRASARKIDAETINAQLDELILNSGGLSVSEVARELQMHPRQLYEIANEKAKKIAQAWRRDRKERAHRNRERAAALIEAAVLDILAEGKGPTLRELKSRIPKEVLGSVREIFTLLEEAKAKVSRR